MSRLERRILEIREIREDEVYKLLECVTQLSEHHNKISVNFRGSYPSRPFEQTLDMFSKNMQNGTSKIAVLDVDETVVGFCKIDLGDRNGKLDYLVVLEEYRGRGFGSALMDWAMKNFDERNISRVEVKVVDGNDAIRLYEKYGFKMNAHILWYSKDETC